MHAEVISIGDELTSGQRLDTNSKWLSERLGEHGIRVMYHTTVADDLEANVRVFQQAIDRADVVVASGGLGPTADDLTREALARTAGVDLVLDEASLSHIKALFARRDRPMPQSNVVQAMLPRGSRAIPNPHGSAPGIAMDFCRPAGGACRLFALPGVPAEMREMWHGSLAAEVGALGVGRVIRHRSIKCFGVGESDLEQMLPDLIRRGRDPSVGITVSGATITLRITAAGATADDCHATMGPTIETIHQCLGTLVFGEEDDELEHVVARQLARHNWTLATAEWGTGGLVAHWLAEAAAAHPPSLSTGGQGGYLGGFVAATPVAISAQLGIPPALVEQRREKGADVVSAMAARSRELLDADLGLAVGEFPEVDPKSAEIPPVFYALATRSGVTVKSHPFFGHPAILKTRCAKQALNLVRLALLEG